MIMPCLSKIFFGKIPKIGQNSCKEVPKSEKLAVIGTERFMVFIEKLELEGVIVDVTEDDDTIIIQSVENDIDISPAYGYPIHLFREKTKNIEVFTTGFHKHGTNIVTIKIFNIQPAPELFFIAFDFIFLTFDKFFLFAFYPKKSFLLKFIIIVTFK